MTITTRFAPSPTGALHLGHIYSASLARDAARAGPTGRYLVRLEDIDPARCRPEHAAAILEDLDWLGLASDEPVRVQSQHLGEYAAALGRLAERGLTYPCFCSRAQVARELAASAIAPHHAPDGSRHYPGACRARPAAEVAGLLAQGAPHAWRLDMRAALYGAPPLRFHERGQGWITADPVSFGDVVLARRDAPASYHLCVTHDDAAQGVSLVTRGCDLGAATHLHVLLQHLLGWPTPEYAHHPLLRAADGARLSKRHGAAAVRKMREAGLTASQVLACVRQAPG